MAVKNSAWFDNFIKEMKKIQDDTFGKVDLAKEMRDMRTFLVKALSPLKAIS
jgi:hypothetical protein